MCSWNSCSVKSLNYKCWHRNNNHQNNVYFRSSRRSQQKTIAAPAVRHMRRLLTNHVITRSRMHVRESVQHCALMCILHSYEKKTKHYPGSCAPCEFCLETWYYYHYQAGDNLIIHSVLNKQQIPLQLYSSRFRKPSRAELRIHHQVGLQCEEQYIVAVHTRSPIIILNPVYYIGSITSDTTEKPYRRYDV